jgi:penicillin amidase
MIRPPRKKSRLSRAIGWIAGGLALIIVLAIALIGGLLWFSQPSSDQVAAISGLSAPVSITMDQDGVPRIHAASEIDAAVALGFVHARDRMFQLELLRRAASGRLSELVGPETLRFDREMRVLGLRFRAMADEATLPAADRAVLEAYARGVNAWISARGRFSAPEFILLGAPEPWQPSDTLLWAKTMGLWLAGNWQQELARLSLLETLPAERIAELWPRRRLVAAAQTASVDGRLVAKAAQVLAALPHFPEPFTLPPDESNAWAVAGRLSATGHPLLAGDPHLVYSLPGQWYLVRIERPEGVWAGGTAPGVPGIVMGRNPHIAWAFTTTGADTQDVFIETPVGDDQYATPDGPRPFTTREERIHVRGEPDVVLKVRETRHGPVISDIAPERDDKLLAVAMASLKPGETTASGFLALNRAGSVAEAGEAAAKITSPVQNMFVADAEHIGLFVTGRVPVRRAGDGSMPVDGADGRHDWLGFASGSQLPVTVDPPSGRMLNANEPVVPPDFPTFLGHDPRGPWRARRIDELLAASNRHTVADFARMQVDAGSTYARQLLPVLRGVAVPEGTARQALAQLRDWDGTMSMDGPQPLIFNAWLARFREDVLRRAGVPEQSPAVSRQDFVAWLLSPNADRAARSAWCDGPCDRMLGKALEGAAAELAARLGPDPAAWRWGAVHRAVFAHPVLRFVPLLGQLTEASAAVPGDTTTINRQEALFGGFESVHGASYRAVYDLADLDRSRFIVAPGQSGNLLSATARVFLERWADGALVALGPDTAAATVTARIQLMPAGAD